MDPIVIFPPPLRGGGNDVSRNGDVTVIRSGNVLVVLNGDEPVVVVLKS